MVYKKSKFRPKKPVRSFRDLEVYQRALEGAVMVAKNILPIIKESEYPLQQDMIKCSLEIPKLIAEAHSLRFDEKKSSLDLLEKVMSDCNKMVVYLEQIRDIYSDKVERVVVEELIRKYISNRKKVFHLFKSWKRFMEEEDKRGF